MANSIMLKLECNYPLNDFKTIDKKLESVFGHRSHSGAGLVGDGDARNIEFIFPLTQLHDVRAKISQLVDDGVLTYAQTVLELTFENNPDENEQEAIELCKQVGMYTGLMFEFMYAEYNEYLPYYVG